MMSLAPIKNDVFQFTLHNYDEVN